MELRKYAGILLTAFCMTAATATSIPNNAHNPSTFLGPTVRLGVTKLVTDDTAFSVAGEAGLRNLRLGGTFGWEFDYNQRIKASAEVLRQKITYSFFSGRESPWLNQTAVGLDYQYDFRNYEPFNTLFDLSGYYSHAPSTVLGVDTGTYIPAGSSTPIPFYDVKRIAGSHAAGVSPGITIATLEGTRVGAEINYDNVHYDTKYRSGENGIGWGGTVKLNQAITQDISVGAQAAVRAPFNNYQADIALDNVDFYGTWVFKLFGAYTIGKNSLPTTYNVGLGADYLIDAKNNCGGCSRSEPMQDFKGEKNQRPYKDFKGYKDYTPCDPPEMVDKDFLSWISVPAVYLPQVLAIAEDGMCIAPQLLVAIPDQEPSPPTATYSFNVGSNFTGTNLHFTLNLNGNPSACASMTGSTVNVTGNAPGCTVGDLNGISITASNVCGTVTSNTFTAFL